MKAGEDISGQKAVDVHSMKHMSLLHRARRDLHQDEAVCKFKESWTLTSSQNMFPDNYSCLNFQDL